MDLEYDSPAAYGLYGYIKAVADELGLTGDSWFVQLEPPVNAYIALDGHFPLYPGRDVALIWHEEHGWATAAEIDSGDDLLILSFLDNDVLPPPRAVARFARSAPGERRSVPPVLRGRNDDDGLAVRLAAYIPREITTTAG